MGRLGSFHTKTSSSQALLEGAGFACAFPKRTNLELVPHVQNPETNQDISMKPHVSSTQNPMPFGSTWLQLIVPHKTREHHPP